ncbi:MAG: TonB-dependent receptor [Acidobacteriota bacterium]
MRKFYFITLIFALLIFLYVPSFSQVSTVSIEGKVVDKEGLPVPGAEVSAKNVETGLAWVTVTSDSGLYYIFSVPPGKYEVKIQHPAYGPQIKTMELLVGQKATVNFTLALKELQEEVVVTAEAPVAELKKSELSIPIRPEQVTYLPLNTRNFLEIATLAPGIKPYGATIASGATLPTNMGFYIDGAEFKNEIVEGGLAGQFVSAGNAFPQDALREFRVITQLYKAEFAKASGGVITAASKTGTNEFHGTAFLTYRDKDLNALGYFEKTKPPYKRRQPGVSLGGPIIKDRFHFFLTYEGTFTESFSTVVPGNPIFSQYAQTFKRPFDGHLGFLRLTCQPSSNNYLDLSLSARYDSQLIGGGGIFDYNFARYFDNYVYTGILRHQYIISPSMMNDIRFSFQRYNWIIDPVSLTYAKRYPSMIIGGHSHSPQNWYQDRYALYDDISYAYSSHLFKAGFFISRLNYQAEQKLFLNPQFYFRKDTDTMPYLGIVGEGIPYLRSSNTQLGIFVQDDWTVNPSLTLNLGIRWDYESNMINNNFVTPEDIKGDLSHFFESKYFSDGTNRKPYLYSFAPRFGFSYDMTKKETTFLTGGFGIAYDRHVWNVASDESLRLTWKVYYIYFSPDGAPGTVKWDEKYYNRSEVLKLIALGVVPPPEIFLISDDIKPPMTLQFSLGIRHRLKDITFGLSYVGVRGYNEIQTYDANYVDATTKKRVLTTKYGRINVWTDEANSWFNSFYLTIDKPYKQGSWGFQVAYTLGWADSEWDNTIYYGYLYYTNPQFLKKAPSNIDERHRVSISGIVDLPLGFQLSSWGTFSTGRPYLVYTGKDDNKDSVLTNDYPPEGRNAKRAPSTKILNLRLSKNFTFKGYSLMAFVDAFNVFNWKNFGGYVGNMLSPKFGVGTTAGAPRQIQLGLRTSF